MIDAKIFFIADAAAAGERWIINAARHRGKTARPAVMAGCSEMSAVTNGNQLAFSRTVLGQCRGRETNGGNCSPKNDLENYRPAAAEVLGDEVK